MTARRGTGRPVVRVNRAPVLTLWGAVVAERLGFDWEEALTLGRALAGLNAYAKGVRLGLFHPTPRAVAERRRRAASGEGVTVDLMHRAIPAVQTPEGIRAMSRGRPIPPESVERYLRARFGEHYEAALSAMRELARSLPPRRLAVEAFHLYEQFRPEVPPGRRGWGAAGELDLGRIRALARAGAEVLASRRGPPHGPARRREDT